MAYIAAVTIIFCIVDAVYERFHKRTVVPMAVHMTLCSTVLTGLLVLFRVLGPRHGKPVGDYGDDNAAGEDEKQSLVENDRSN